MTRTKSTGLAIAMLAGSALAFTAISGMQVHENHHTGDPAQGRFKLAASTNTTIDEAGKAAKFAVHIRQPQGSPQVELAGTDPQGRAAHVACSTCHSVRPANLDNSVDQLNEFHQGFQFQHGNLNCYACHNPNHADTLRRADGQALLYQDVLELCSQCHSSQATSFAHGAHGGMNGFWDLTRGPQFKNNCIDCHDPHAPQYPRMVVGFKPKDRFNQEELTHDNHK